MGRSPGNLPPPFPPDGAHSPPIQWTSEQAPFWIGQRAWVWTVPTTTRLTMFVENVSPATDSCLMIGDWRLYVEN